MDPVAPLTPRFKSPLVYPILIGVAAVVPFLPSLRGEFLLWDDDANFLYNPSYRGLGLENLRWMFTNTFAHYMPLTWLSLGFDYTLWGMNPAGYHATNLLLHGLNAALFYLVLKSLVRSAKPDLEPSAAAAAAAFGALVFAVHPLRVESVAWITERRDLLSAAFFLLTLLAYLRRIGAPEGTRERTKWLLLANLSFVAMLLSKSMGLTLPLVLVILDVYPLRRFSRAAAPALLKEKLSLFVLMFAALAMVSYTSSKTGAISSREQYPLIQSIARPGFSLAFYIGMTLLPRGISPLYWYRPELGIVQAAGWVVVLALSAAAWALRRRFPAALAAWLSYGLLLSPVSGVVSLGPVCAADHYTYVACLPFAALAAALVVLLRRTPPLAMCGAAAAMVITLSAWSWRYCGTWKDSVSLWSRAIELEPDVYFSLANRGRAYAARRDWDRALGDYDRSLQLQGAWNESWGYRAEARLARGDPGGAIADATQALRLDPSWTQPYKTRGVALAALARPREAIQDFSQALALRPQYVEVRIDRAVERAKIGDLDGALSDLDAAIAFDPQPEIYVRRGITRGMMQDSRGAAEDFSRALELAPADWPQRRKVQEYLQQLRSP
jgi:tetratricopeptide (TPR) repeat protein